MLSVLLIEDDMDLAGTVIDFLELEDIRCDHAANGMNGLTLMERGEYDVLLLDLNLPRMDGLAVCENLREKGDDTPILMLTARDSLDDKVKGFGAGSDDYLVKPFEMQELVVRIQALSRRRSGQVKRLECGDLSLDLSEKLVVRAGQTLKVSPTGLKILEVLLRKTPAVVSRSEMETQVWGDEPPDSNSLKVHIFNLRKAIDSPFEHAMVHTVSGHGFVLKSTDAE